MTYRCAATGRRRMLPFLAHLALHGVVAMDPCRMGA
jgi:hypothetical protein